MARTAASEAEVKAAVEQTSQRPSPSAPSLLLIDFFASWCGPCKQIGPLVDKLSKDLRHEVAFLKVDVDALPQVAAQFGVKAMPTFKLVHKGKIVAEVVGADEAHLRSVLQRHVVACALDEFVDRWLSAWTGGDAAPLLRFYTEDCIYSDPQVRTGVKGQHELRRYLNKLLAANPRWEWSRERAWLAEDDDSFFLRWRARIPVGDGVLEEEGADIVKVVANPKYHQDSPDEPRFIIARNDVFFDRSRWLTALGVAKGMAREPAKL